MNTLLTTVTLLLSAVRATRETVNFDFSWRHQLTNSSHHERKKCQPSEPGINFGSGGRLLSSVPSDTACCDHCSNDPFCGCWDWATDTHNCWIKTNCTSVKTQLNRVSAQMLLPPNDANNYHKISYNDSHWDLVDAPHDMLITQAYDPNADEKQAFLPRNVGWYRKHFYLPLDWINQSIWFECEGSFHESIIWINGQKVNSSVGTTTSNVHKAGYTSFIVRIDDVPGIHFGSGRANLMALYIDASTGTGWWYEGGGLMRHNYLISTSSKVHLLPGSGNGAWVYADTIDVSAKKATLRMTATVVNPGNVDYVVKCTIIDSNGTIVGSVTSDVRPYNNHVVLSFNDFSKKHQLQLWSVRHPHLYTVHFAVLSPSTNNNSGELHDQINVTTGIRAIVWDANHGLILNGKNVKLRGFCDHSNFGGVGGALPDRINLYRAQTLRSVGGNSWRMAHNPPSPARLDFMDRLGMLAIDENRDYGGHKGQGGDTTENVNDELNDMADLVRRDRSHPSVMIWSFCNEVGCNNESSAKGFRQVAKLWDATRAVTQNRVLTNVSSFWLDVQGFSHKKSEIFDIFHKNNPKKPMIASFRPSSVSISLSRWRQKLVSWEGIIKSEGICQRLKEQLYTCPMESCPASTCFVPCKSVNNTTPETRRDSGQATGAVRMLHHHANLRSWLQRKCSQLQPFSTKFCLRHR